MQRHVIQRARLELMAPADRANLEGDWANRLFYNDLMDLIGEVCDELCAPDVVYRIERVELDLRDLPIDRLLASDRARIRDQLRRAIARHLTHPEPARKSAIELLTTFATTGVFPWWADVQDPLIISQQLTTAHPTDLLALLRAITPLQTRRLVRHADDETLKITLLRILPAEMTQASLGQTFTRLMDHVRDRDQAWAALLQAAVFATDEQSLLDRVFAYVDRPTGTMQPVTDTPVEDLTASVSLDDLVQTLARAGAVHDPIRFLQTTLLNLRIPRFQWPQVLLTVQQHANLSYPWQNAFIALIEETQPLANSQQSGHDALYIHNAGLVILWPFLTTFFKRIGLWDGDTWHDENAPGRALALLQFIATGEDHLLEYQLGLNKVLCGLPLHTPLLAVNPPSAEAFEESEDLLRAVIASASILGEMSLDGLRGSFLLRAGTLTIRDGIWLLRVESKGYDVVLSRFPWNWEVVRLPWMPGALQVEWQS